MSASSPSPAARSLRVLYAEDMKELRELLEIVLTRDGHRVETVPDGEVAWQRLQQEPEGFDLIITDHHMPNLNGLELISRVREASYPGKVLVFSSELSTAIHERYRQLQVDRILHKPIFPGALRQALAGLFNETPHHGTPPQ